MEFEDNIINASSVTGSNDKIQDEDENDNIESKDEDSNI